MKRRIEKKISPERSKVKDKAKAKKSLRIIGLESLKPPLGANRKRKYLGRGSSSGHGKTSTRGHKGQTSRAGRDFYPGFEGGQMPLIRKIPKRGFNNVNRKEYQIVNLKDLGKIKQAEITPQLLEEKGLIKSKDRLIKILAEGEVAQGLNIKANAFSKSALKKIEKAGGKIEIINA